MSQEIAITAILQPAEGKLERLTKFMGETISWIKENEPETLEFSLYEVNTDEGVKVMLFERYASEEAMKKHENTPQYKKVFETMMGEQLLSGAPTILKPCRPGPGFRR